MMEPHGIADQKTGNEIEIGGIGGDHQKGQHDVTLTAIRTSRRQRGARKSVQQR